jgi:hypothetical protein
MPDWDGLPGWHFVTYRIRYGDEKRPEYIARPYLLVPQDHPPGTGVSNTSDIMSTTMTDAALLNPQLTAVYDQLHTYGPQDISKPILKATSDIKATFDPKQAIRPGNKLPSFSLRNATNKQITSDSLLARGPILIIFYRGAWCPFCNLFVRAYQSHLPQFKAHGVQLVAITAEVPDKALVTAQKNELQFPVLSDTGLIFARKLGIV